MADVPYVPVCLSLEGAPADDDECHGVTNEAYIFAAKQQANTTYTLGGIDIAVMIAFALWQRKTSSDIADMQEEVADEQMQLAEKLHAHAKLFWTQEKALVDQAFGEPRAATDYFGLSAGWQSYVSDSLDTGRGEWAQELTRVCSDATACEDARWRRTSALMQADMLAFAGRQAEARAQTLRDRRYERQYNALKMGHGVLHYTMQFQSAALALGTQAHNVLFGSVNSLLRETGYWAQYNQPTMWSHLPSSSRTAMFSGYMASADTNAQRGFLNNPVKQDVLPAETPSVNVTVKSGMRSADSNSGAPASATTYKDLYLPYPTKPPYYW